MLRTLLSGTVVWATGCIIPAAIDPEDPGLNATPTITGGTPDFTKGAFTPEHFDSPITFKVTARDSDVNDPLYAQLYRLDGDGPLAQQMNITLTPTSNDGVERTGSFPDYPWCKQWVENPRQWFVYVYVSDLPIPDSIHETPKAARSDNRYWVVNCQ